MIRPRWILVLALWVGMLPQSGKAQGAAASAEATEEARTHFKLGVDLYRERNYRAALIEFQRAYTASPHYKLLYNLGQTALELHEDVSALEYLSEYLVRGEGQIPSERKQEVEETIVRLKARLAMLAISSNQEEVSIYIDDKLAGSTPIREPLKVSVGRHTVSARKNGYLQLDRVVDVAAGDRLQLTLELEREPPAAGLMPPQAQAASAADGDEGLPASTWMFITTAGLGAGALSLAIATAVAERSYVEEKRGLTTSKELQQLRNDAKTKALVADVLWGATAVSAVISAVLFVSEANEESEPADSVRLRVGATGLIVQGRL
jgi:tetratricopeptide (TPR) repeat protein